MSINRLITPNRELNQIQDNILNEVNPLLRNPLLNGVILKGINLQLGSNIIPHGLNQALTGWIIIRRLGEASVYESTSNNKTLTLNASASVTLDLYVF